MVCCLHGPLLVFMIFAAVSTQLGVINAQRITPVMSLFNFYTQDCLNGVFPDSQPAKVLGDIRVYNPTALCISGNGMANRQNGLLPSASRVAHAYSTASLDTAVKSIAMQASTVDLWLRADSLSTGNNISVIMSLLTNSTRDLVIAQRDESLLALVYEGGQDTLSSANPIPLPTNGVLTSNFQLTITTQYRAPTAQGVARAPRLTFYVNGTLASQVILRTTTRSLTYWNASTKLAFFSEPPARAKAAGHTAWKGEIHLFAMYNRTLSAAEALQNALGSYPKVSPTMGPTVTPTTAPSPQPSSAPTISPTPQLTLAPTAAPTTGPTGMHGDCPQDLCSALLTNVRLDSRTLSVCM